MSNTPTSFHIPLSDHLFTAAREEILPIRAQAHRMHQTCMPLEPPDALTCFYVPLAGCGIPTTREQIPSVRAQAHGIDSSPVACRDSMHFASRVHQRSENIGSRVIQYLIIRSGKCEHFPSRSEVLLIFQNLTPLLRLLSSPHSILQLPLES